jgi:hypothetical protein
MRTVGAAVLAALLFAYPLAARADKVIENYFASIALNGKKIGQIHFTLISAPTGEIEELHTNSSVTMLGIKVYTFAQHLHETWRNGSLQTLRSDADDNGTEELVRLKRSGSEFDAERNGNSVDVPANVFPDSIWHYTVTKQTRLFNSVDLKIMNVTVSRADDTISYLGKPTAAEKFTFSGDWDATLWFGKNQRLLQAHRSVNGRTIVITIDPDK